MALTTQSSLRSLCKKDEMIHFRGRLNRLNNFFNNGRGMVNASIIDQDNLVFSSQGVEVSLDGFKALLETRFFVIKGQDKRQVNHKHQIIQLCKYLGIPKAVNQQDL